MPGLGAERARLYMDLALSSLSKAARNALEALMQSGQQILACTELAQLKDWLRKAVTVESVQEPFGPTTLLRWN